MRISIIGLGWFGYPLAKALLKEGHEILGTTRTKEKMDQMSAEGIAVSILSGDDTPPKELLLADVIVLNIPPSETQLDWFKRWEWQNKKIIFISSTSTYPVPDSLGGKILVEEENWVKAQFTDWCILRFGGLLGAGRHPGKYLSGRTNIKGRLMPVNLIHLDDCVEFTKIVIEKNLFQKVFHVVADDHRGREEFYGGYCRQKKLPLPQFDQEDQTPGKIVPNDEMKVWYTPVKDLWEE